jgi:hypothetical protein
MNESTSKVSRRYPDEKRNIVSKYFLKPNLKTAIY